MLLALVLAAAPVTISIAADTVAVDGRVLKAPVDDALMRSAVDQALSNLADAGSLDVRIDLVGAQPFRQLERVLAATGLARARTVEVRLEGAEPFQNVMTPGQRRSLGVIRVSPDGVWVDALQLRSDGGVVDGVQLGKSLQAPRPDGVVRIEVDHSVSSTVLAPLVETCRRGGYQLALVSPAPARVKSSASVCDEQEAVSAMEMESARRTAVRDTIKAHRKPVRACYDKVLAKDLKAAGRVSVMFTITAGGKVAKASVESNTVGDDGLGECLVKAVKKWVFPRGADGEVNYPFVFAPP